MIKKNILVVFGTRPEAIKMAPLVKELKTIFRVKLCITAQHREMLDEVLEIFSIESDYDLDIMTPGQNLTDIEIDTVFIGSCTNGRIEDLRAAAEILKGKKVKDGLRAMIVPGSGLVRAQAEEEGLADIFKEAGFEWRLAGCSMCLAMNPDQLTPGERCAATSNRNFEGRQGRGGRTHLMSPAMAAAAAITGRLTDVREMM